MSGNVQVVKDGTVTSPRGFVAGASYAGMKTYSQDKMDLGILLSKGPCLTVGTYTTNSLPSLSVVLTKQQVAAGRVRGAVASSGIANACVGQQGMVDAQEMVDLAAKHVGVAPEELGVCTTGLVGVELPMALIRSGMPKVTLSEAGGAIFARAIMTTDKRPKSIAVTCKLGGKVVTLGGCIKGSGMIHPNMATMLCFLTTDAAFFDREYAQGALRRAVDNTLNMASIDGDGSTNDTVLLFASGVAGNAPVTAGSPDASVFEEALTAICTELTKELMRDAETAVSTIFSVTVEGARNDADARSAARTIASSSLVKAAVHGNDPNWGRVIVALGNSGAEVNESQVALLIDEVAIMEEGKPIPFHKDAIVAMMRELSEVSFTIRLGLGDANATAWGCELTEEYVTFNSAYTT
jgi:glutamate N-acetyltransferase/amino-acid N-acetyltransferase